MEATRQVFLITYRLFLHGHLWLRETSRPASRRKHWQDGEQSREDERWESREEEGEVRILTEVVSPSATSEDTQE